MVQSGQSGQPSPDLLSRTASPVDMMTALAITAASARPRIDSGVGRSTSPASRVTSGGNDEGRAAGLGPGAGVTSAGTLPIVGDLPPPRLRVPATGA